MPDKRDNKEVHDSTTDFFLKIVKKEKAQIEKEKEPTNTKAFDFKTSKTFDRASHIYNYVNKAMDHIFASNRNILILSIVLTLFLFFTINGGDVLSSTTSGTTLENVPIKVEGLDDDYEISGVPSSITVGLIGPSLDIYSAKINGNYEIILDVTGKTTGDYTVNLEASGFSDSLTVMMVPNSLKVTIAKKIESTYQLGYQFINTDQMSSEYSVSLDSIDTKNVTVRASKATLDSISKVQACIDVSDQTKDFEQDAQIKAYDQQGNELDVEITPSSAHVNCLVSSYSKEVSIKPQFVGDLKEGYALKNYSLSSSTVKIYGRKELLQDISEVTCEIDVSGLEDSTSFNNIALDKVDGIDKLSIEDIDVNIEIEKSITKKFDKIPIKVLNKTDGTKVSFVGSNNYASVSVTGASSKVSDVTEDNIEATIDVNQLDVGSQKVSVKVVIDDDTLDIRLLSSSEISINIERN